MYLKSLLFSVAVLLAGCATSDFDPDHIYEGPKRQPGELALVLGQQRGSAGIEFSKIDGRSLGTPLTGGPMAIYLLPGRHFIEAKLLQEKRLEYMRGTTNFNVNVHPGGRYAIKFANSVEEGDNRVMYWFEDLDSGAKIDASAEQTS